MVLQNRLAIWKKSSAARKQSSRRNRRPSAPNRAHVAAAESLEPRAMLTLTTNAPPTDLFLSNNEIVERAGPNAVVGSFFTIDPNDGDTFKYSLVQGTGAKDNSLFAINGSELCAKSSLNYEIRNSYSIRVRSTDQGGMSFDRVLPIRVTDAAELSRYGFDRLVIEAYQAGQTLDVDNLRVVDLANGRPVYANNFDSGSTEGLNLTYWKDAGIAPAFDDTKTRILNGRLRLECTGFRQNGTGGYNSRARAIVDSSLPEDFEITFTLHKNTWEGHARVYILPSGHEHTFNLPPGPLDGGFATNIQGGQINYASVLGLSQGSETNLLNPPGPGTDGPYDFTDVQYRIVKQGASLRMYVQNELCAQTDSLVLVAPTAISLTSQTVTENAPTGTVVGGFSTADRNAGDAFVYSLVGGYGDTDNSAFDIIDGKLRTKTVFDYETKNSRSIRVRSTDSSGLFIESSFALRVTNAFPDAPYSITLSRSTVNENQPLHTVVGALASLDDDTGDRLTYTLVAGPGGADNTAFEIVDGQVRTLAQLDREATPFRSIRVRSTDSFGLFHEQAFSIAVENVNEQPTGIALSSSSVLDGSAIETVIGQLSATDPDSGDNFTYVIVAGAGDTNNAAFKIVGNQLRVATVPTFASASTRSVRIRTTDSGGLSVEQSFVIAIACAPTEIGLQGSSVAENSQLTTLVGTFYTTDRNTDDTFSYELVSGFDDGDNTAFEIANGELWATALFDFETQTSYRIRVRSTDSGQLFTEASFTITVSDVSPEPPKAILLSATTVAENESAQTVVGTLTSLDDDAGDTFTYQLVAGSGDADNVSFEIVADQLRTAAQLDREAKPVRSVRIRSTDSLGLVREQMFQITVSNVNEQPTGIALSSTNVLDGSAIETVVGRLSATDPDSGDSFTYALVAGTGDTDNAAFKIVGSQLRVAAVPRFAAGSTRTVRLQATDAGGLTTERAFTIIVDDQNDAPTDILLQPNTIAENQPAGSAVGTLTAVDPDMGGRYSFALVGGAGAGDNPLFTIVSGQVRSKAPFNYEARSQYSVRIRVTDQGGLFMEKVLPVLVTDANDAPTNITLSAATVAENSATGTLVGTLAATDVDAGDSFTYSLVAGNGAADNAGFVIQGAEVRTTRSFDFEAQRALSVRVRATDAAGAAFEKTLKISVTNVNEAPTDVRIYGGTVAENLPAGTVAASLAAVDPDTASQFTYGLVDGSGSDGNPYFTIRGNQVLTGAPLDFEARPDYSIRVRATDTSGLATEKAITIRVTDVNEAPTGLALSKATVAENLPAGTAVGTFTASDPDANNTFTYLLASGAGGNGNRFFQIVGNELRTAAPFDREAKSSYSVRVQTVDQSGASAFGVFIIRIDDVNEAPTAITMTGGTIAENSAPGTVAARFGTTDPDRSDTFTYSLVSGAGDSGNSMFAILGNQLVAAGDLDFETARQWTVRLRSTDSGGQSVESRFTIAVTDVNERPRTLSLVQQALSGQIAAGAVVGRLSATDADAGERLSYSLVSGTGDTGNALFSLNGNSLRTKTAMTFEPGRSYSVRIRVTDKGGLTLEQVFEIVPLSATVALRAGA